MMRQRFTLPRYGGHTVLAFFDVDSTGIGGILSIMRQIGCDEDTLESTRELLSDHVNTGATYTVGDTSVMIVGKATSALEFLNTCFHEMFHVTIHISKRMGFDLESEDPAYLYGEISEKMKPVLQYFVCG